jgi:hypothetical protein
MGAWGIKNFENDDALDWVYDLVRQSNKNFIINALNKVIRSDDYIEAPESCDALCAIEIIACVKNNRFTDLPEGVESWLKKKHGIFRKIIEFNEKDINLAKTALKKIIKESELKELWEESEDYQEWLSYLGRINNEL